jgi:hypothetical protein
MWRYNASEKYSSEEEIDLQIFDSRREGGI